MQQVWGIHNDTLTDELTDEGFISIGWDHIGDLNQIPDGREGLKKRLAEGDPDSKPGAIPVWAGVLYRFGHDITHGDVIVAPFKPTSTINIGIVSGGYYFAADAPTHRHRIPVRWVKVGLPCTVFSQPALYEIGSALTLFRVQKHAAEFRAAMGSSGGADEVEAASRAVHAAAQHEPEDSATEEPRASRIQRHTRDFLLDALSTRLGNRDFEELTAALLQAMGYQARVTPFSQDGGIDVIAHTDPLGVEPPQIKVQCKHTTSTIGSPEVQRLIGS